MVKEIPQDRDKGLEYRFLLDALEEEQEQGAAIDIITPLPRPSTSTKTAESKIKKEWEENLFHPQDVPSFDDFGWDTMPKRDRDKHALAQAQKTAIFAKLYVPFYRKLLEKFRIKDIEDIASLEEFACAIPQTTKQHLSNNSFSAFLPEGTDLFGMINKGTAGTTGKPVTVWYSQSDWEAMAQHIARSIKFDFRDKLDELKGLKILGLYHGDLVTNEIYRAGLKLLSIHLARRASTKSDPVSNYDLLQHLRVNGILAPPATAQDKKQTKGITLDKILELDAKNLNASCYRLSHKENPEFKMVLWSSMPLTVSTYEYLKNHLGIPYIQGQHGSTECFPTGATCEHNPFSFHLGYGPTLVNVVHPNGNRLIKEGERGYILVTKTGGLYKGRNIVPTGTNLINFRTGDWTEPRNINGEKCQCGRNTPYITDLQRRELITLKARFGYQID